MFSLLDFPFHHILATGHAHKPTWMGPWVLFSELLKELSNTWNYSQAMDLLDLRLQYKNMPKEISKQLCIWPQVDLGVVGPTP